MLLLQRFHRLREIARVSFDADGLPDLQASVRDFDHGDADLGKVVRDTPDFFFHHPSSNSECPPG
jgi:hypothetical protein